MWGSRALTDRGVGLSICRAPAIFLHLGGWATRWHRPGSHIYGASSHTVWEFLGHCYNTSCPDFWYWMGIATALPVILTVMALLMLRLVSPTTAPSSSTFFLPPDEADNLQATDKTQQQEQHLKDRPHATSEKQRPTSPLIIWLAVFAICMVLIMFEEAGWRGYALPRLLYHSFFSGGSSSLPYSAADLVWSNVFLGTMWSLWHLPIFFWNEYPLAVGPPRTASRIIRCFGGYTVCLAVVSILIGWIHLRLGGCSVLPSLAFHSSLNASVAACGLKRLNMFMLLIAVASLPVVAVIPIIM